MPILVGTKVRDPSGSDISAPVVGICHKVSGVPGSGVRPLIGSMESSNGEGLCAIEIGCEGVDSTTG